jgi:hypothetical protein
MRTFKGIVKDMGAGKKSRGHTRETDRLDKFLRAQVSGRGGSIFEIVKYAPEIQKSAP